jgi:hypothetical protein
LSVGQTGILPAVLLNQPTRLPATHIIGRNPAIVGLVPMYKVKTRPHFLGATPFSRRPHFLATDPIFSRLLPKVRLLSWTPFSPSLKRQPSIILLASPTQNSEAPNMLTDPNLPPSLGGECLNCSLYFGEAHRKSVSRTRLKRNSLPTTSRPMRRGGIQCKACRSSTSGRFNQSQTNHAQFNAPVRLQSHTDRCRNESRFQR